MSSVHSTHCCKIHGCKYGNEDYPVVLGNEEQEYPCEECSDESDVDDYEEMWEELKEYLIRAEKELYSIAEKYENDIIEKKRVMGKADGVSLAISCMNTSEHIRNVNR
jgi:hypothetical protein